MPKPILKVKLMLDSGAFSAWNRDEEIDIKEYIAFIKRNARLLHSYVNLDVIPGEHGQRRSTDDVESSAKASYDNLQIMKADGLRPIPVFHHGESLTWLERLLKDGEPYIGLSASKDARPRDHIKWLDRIFKVLIDSKGRPLVKTHGFGITNPRLLFRYPWHTVDSTTWSITPGYGQIIVPVYINGKPEYGRQPVRVIVSGQQQQSNQLQFNSLGPVVRACVENFLGRVGITISEARHSTEARRKAVLLYYVELCKHLQGVRAAHNTVKFPFHIMYATAMRNKQWSGLLTEHDAMTRLISFYELKDPRPKVDLTDPIFDDALREYVSTGLLVTPIRKIKRTDKIFKSRVLNAEEREQALLEALEGNVKEVAKKWGLNPTTLNGWRSRRLGKLRLSWKREGYKNLRIAQTSERIKRDAAEGTT